jgi:putative glutamine amidotransferase
MYRRGVSSRGNRPVVLVSAGFTDYGDYLGVALSQPLEQVGALPLMLPCLRDVKAAVALADGILLGFGRDLDPALYGARPHPAQTAVSPHRDEFELRLAAAALREGLPVLGICRGMQLINVVHGGTLHRDRSEYPPGAVDHPGGDWARWERVCDAALGRGAMPAHPGHELSIAPGSRLASALRTQHAWVNSYHHQAVREIGRGLKPVAWAEDGIVEALESEDRSWLLGVQWELQESWRDDFRFLEVFAAFADAARRARPAAAASG